MKITFTIFLCLYNLLLFGQQNVVGIIQDAETGEHIPFVNIGILEREKGTVSDASGKFLISIPSEFTNDSIRISAIGYKTQTFIIGDFIRSIQQDSVITLNKDVVVLNAVIVTPKNLKVKVLGNTKQSRIMRGGFRNAELGNEIGLKIKIKKSPTYITAFHSNITSNTGQKLKFRLNFYSIEKGFPAEKLINQNIIFQIDSQEGDFTLDLTQYNIKVEEDFFLTMELIENASNKESELFFSAGLFGKGTVTRLTSQAEWKKLGGIGIGFNVTSEYQK